MATINQQIQNQQSQAAQVASPSSSVSDVVETAKLPKDSVPYFIDLQYPPHWLAQPNIHPAAKTMQADVLRRLDSFGLLSSPDLHRMFNAMDIAGSFIFTCSVFVWC